ncbi:unnamed protein product [Ilex paraguariensis]|uniref:Uncharacterized protein n=1 Tax=Ilex paraguariensis TaxID=185542 RepID=A0ABC8RAV1_9AQUA
MVLEFEKYCIVEGSPTTVLPFPRHCSKIEKRNTKLRSKCGNNLWSLHEDFTEIDFQRYRSASCRNISSRSVGQDDNELRRRGSVYRSSNNVRRMKETEADEGRRKIELSQSSATTFSVGIVDSLCSSDEDSSFTEKRSSVMYQNSDLSKSVHKPHIEPCFQGFLDLSSQSVSERGVSSDGFLEISLDSENRENRSAGNAETQPIEDSKLRCDPGAGPLNEADANQVRGSALSLHKSLSAKLALPHSPARTSESDCSKASSPKSRFSPIRKMFDPFVKSKSQRSPLGSAIEASEVRPTAMDGFSRSKTFRKSLLHNFSNTSQSTECSSRFVNTEQHNSVVPCSPAQLHGLLKFENEHGVPSFEFTVKSSPEVLVAKTWKVDNSLNWAYTFHSGRSKRKSNTSGWGLKDNKKQSPMVGQMQVSCYLCTELRDAGAFDNSMVTEFVLYDTARAGKSIAVQDNTNCSHDLAKPINVFDERLLGGTCKLDDVSHQAKLEGQQKHASNIGHSDTYLDIGHSDLSIPHHLRAAALHPNLETAAIVIQSPIEKRESLKCKGGDRKTDQSLPNLFDVSGVKHIKKGGPDCLAKVNVVIPFGSHSLPSSESRGPSPLLDRWRLGGGCDCGGWDMACPLIVLGNPNIQSAEDHLHRETQQPLVLFVQGSKENTPALTITGIEDGQYAIDFHAQLTTLQAFSICVAILHTIEASSAVEQDRDKKLMQCDSMRVLIDEEVKYLIEAVTEEESKKANKKMEQVSPSFVLNPPFSPIARV